jgi:ribosomal protein S18 acetylase RimI-like enzyme
MTQGDLHRLKQIADLSFSWFLRFFANHSLREEGQVLLCEDREEIVGFVKLIEFNIGTDKYGCILWIAVHPHFRQKGFATALACAGIQRLKQDRARTVFASTRRKNKAALATLGKAGFEQVGFLALWRLFRWRIFEFYRDIWFAPGEVIMRN